MGQRGFLWLMAAALALITAAFYFASERGLPRDPAGTPLLPALAARVDEVTAVLIRKGGPEPVVTLRKVGDAWIVAGSGERASYGVLPPIAVTADPADWRDARAVPSPPGEPAS